MSQDSFSLKNPYVEGSDGAFRISANWSIRNNGPKFPTRGIMSRLLASTPYSMIVNVYFSKGGSKVLAAQIGYNTL